MADFTATMGASFKNAELLNSMQTIIGETKKIMDYSADGILSAEEMLAYSAKMISYSEQIVSYSAQIIAEVSKLLPVLASKRF